MLVSLTSDRRSMGPKSEWKYLYNFMMHFMFKKYAYFLALPTDKL